MVYSGLVSWHEGYFSWPALVVISCRGNSFLSQLKGMVFSWVQGTIFTFIPLVLKGVTMCNIMRFGRLGFCLCEGSLLLVYVICVMYVGCQLTQFELRANCIACILCRGPCFVGNEVHGRIV